MVDLRDVCDCDDLEVVPLTDVQSQSDVTGLTVKDEDREPWTGEGAKEEGESALAT